jgi:DNA (cytosine-5)-methyltransferase 1
MPYDLTDEQRQAYRDTSLKAKLRKAELIRNFDPVETTMSLLSPRLDPAVLMPQLQSNGLATLSLFSGGGGLDLGFERSGFEHVASYEILDICGKTLQNNRPGWKVFTGESGNVQNANWRLYSGVDIIQGGPPCQPFSTAGKQVGAADPRNMWPEFVRCVLSLKPKAFIAENVPGLMDEKFSEFVQNYIIDPLIGTYSIKKFVLRSEDFGVPQARKRVFFIGFKNPRHMERFISPQATHGLGLNPYNFARHSIGLPDIGYDALVPTLRSGFTGPRKTTSVVNSKASMILWNKLGIWPHGVQPTPLQAAIYPPENGHHRLSGRDCGILQGFPLEWQFAGAAYQILGQIGNSVSPPVAYAVARNVATALGAVR